MTKARKPRRSAAPAAPAAAAAPAPEGTAAPGAGANPAEFQALQAEVKQLKAEVAQLRGQLAKVLAFIKQKAALAASGIPFHRQNCPQAKLLISRIVSRAVWAG